MILVNPLTISRITAVVATIFFLSQITGAQCEQPVPNRCAEINQAKAPLYLLYEAQTTSGRKNSHAGNVLWLRLANNSTCDAYIPTVKPYRSGIGTGKPIRTTRDRERVEIVYVLDDEWEWGHAFGVFILKSRRSILFALPREELAGRSNLWVPVTFDLNTPFTSLDIGRVCLRLDQLPRSAFGGTARSIKRVERGPS